MRFVLLDQITSLVPGERASARKTFDPADRIFEDHFPGNPVVPGVLLTEAMSQTAGWLVLATLRFSKFPMLGMIRSAKFRRNAVPGTELQIDAVIESIEDETSIVRSEVRSGGERIADATIVFHHFPLTEATSPSLRDWAKRTFSELGGERLLEAAAR